MDCDLDGSDVLFFDGVCSNPYPFLLWIATKKIVLVKLLLSYRSNPYPFLLWIATVTFLGVAEFLTCSNPYPFLLWIATLSKIDDIDIENIVVTLIHFYCGLRLVGLPTNFSTTVT